MDSRNAEQKREISTKVACFPYCGFKERITGNIRYYKSFIGRDFKAFMQMSLFIVPKYLTDSETKCWYLLSKVKHHGTYIVIVILTDFSLSVYNAFHCLLTSSMNLVPIVMNLYSQLKSICRNTLVD